MLHPRWEHPAPDTGDFRDEDLPRWRFRLLAGVGGSAVLLLAGGLWRLQAAALAAPTVVGVAGGRVFSGPPQPLDTLRLADFDAQFQETLEALFGRTERGAPPALKDFCAPEVIAAVDRDYRDAASKYPAGFVQTLSILESKDLAAAAGTRRVLYRGTLASRSVAAAQASAVYFDCTFAMAGAAPLNASGWKLVRVAACSRDDFYRDEVEAARREALGLGP